MCVANCHQQFQSISTAHYAILDFRNLVEEFQLVSMGQFVHLLQIPAPVFGLDQQQKKRNGNAQIRA
jgi:hypothetical protein